MPLCVRAILLWLLLMPLAVINGYVRQYVYRPSVGDLAAHQFSTFIFVAVIFLVVFVGFGAAKASRRDWLLVGFGWLLATVAFEFLAGHYLFGSSWEKLLGDYNLLAGRLWLLVLVTLAAAPLLTARLRNHLC